MFAVETIPKTEVFGTDDYHTTPEKDGVYIGGMVAGFVLFGTLMIYAIIRIWIDEVQRHILYNKEIKADLSELNSLGCDIRKINDEFVLMNKGKLRVGGEEEPRGTVAPIDANTVVVAEEIKEP